MVRRRNSQKQPAANNRRTPTTTTFDIAFVLNDGTNDDRGAGINTIAALLALPPAIAMTLLRPSGIVICPYHSCPNRLSSHPHGARGCEQPLPQPQSRLSDVQAFWSVRRRSYPKRTNRSIALQG